MLPLLTVCHPSPAAAANWVPITNDGKSTWVFVDSSSVQLTGAHAKAWFLLDYGGTSPVPGANPPATAMSEKDLDMFNCDERTYGSVQQTYLAEAAGSGKVVLTRSVPPTAVYYTDVVPDSMGEVMLSFVCAGRHPKKGASM
ncbi:hypothetical protein PQR01_00280 [Paraburkholderia rhynchosiae]|uniref:Uncharacterized protein n=1 Tax=Paraburkholderia rhynchosiae TaxID=487049 RepID=A0ACC7N4F3_9BURK